MTLQRLATPGAWQPLIDGFLTTSQAGGAPATTLNTRRQHLAHMARRIGLEPAEVDGTVLVEWVAAQDWKRETRRGRRSTFRAFWSWAVEAGRLDEDAAASLPVVSASPPAPRPMPAAVLEVALARATPRERLILELATQAGLRRAEIAQCHTSDVLPDLLGYSLLVHGKGGRDRVVPLNAGLAASLRERPAGWVFPGRDRGHLSAEYVGKLAARLLPGAWTLHAGRHRFATLAHRESGDLLVVQDLLGHASPMTTRAYVAPDTTRARSVVDAIAA